MLRAVFKSSDRSEAELVRARLEAADFHPVLTGAAQHSSLMPMVMELESVVTVPAAEEERAFEFLETSRLALEGTAPSDTPVEGTCPVHEQPAVATCDRCGTFLCARCGSLGVPPLCEECVLRTEKPRERPRWVTNVARAWFIVWAGSLLVSLLAFLAYLLR